MTLTYLTARNERRTLTFHTREAFEVALRMAQDGGLIVVQD